MWTATSSRLFLSANASPRFFEGRETLVLLSLYHSQLMFENNALSPFNLLIMKESVWRPICRITPSNKQFSDILHTTHC